MPLHQTKSNDVFFGAFGERIELAFEPPMPLEPDHVVAFIIFHGRLVLMEHKVRGIEWPGGKIEPGETAEETLYREILEETGCQINGYELIAQYQIFPPEGSPFVKNIYAASIDALPETFPPCEESNGYCLFPLDGMTSRESGFSEYMLDGVFETVRKVMAARLEQSA